MCIILIDQHTLIVKSMVLNTLSLYYKFYTKLIILYILYI